MNSIQNEKKKKKKRTFSISVMWLSRLPRSTDNNIFPFNEPWKLYWIFIYAYCKLFLNNLFFSPLPLMGWILFYFIQFCAIVFFRTKNHGSVSDVYYFYFFFVDSRREFRLSVKISFENFRMKKKNHLILHVSPISPKFKKKKHIHTHILLLARPLSELYK